MCWLAALCVLLSGGAAAAGDPASATAAATASPPTAAAAGTTPAGDAATPADAEPTAPAATPTPSEIEPELLERCAAATLVAGCEALETAAGPFLVRFVAAREPPARGAVLLVPSAGSVITATPLIDALAAEFPPNGWAVLAVQLPLLAPAATRADYATTTAAARARLDAALARLTGTGIQRVVVLGLEDGAALLASALAEGYGNGVVQGFASRGRWQSEATPQPLPRLELLAEPDPQAAALADARRRATAPDGSAVEAAQRDYPGAGERFSGFAPQIARDLRGWIKAAVGD